MKIPRDVSAAEIISALTKLNYFVTRQNGSHIRLSNTSLKNDHHITIPNHSPIKIGTLNHILNDISEKLEISKDELNRKLFG
jgi:predicted RNA binding protein YcfA (HicA-like mRNA interferase family)